MTCINSIKKLNAFVWVFLFAPALSWAELCEKTTHSDIVIEISPPASDGGRLIVTAFGDGLAQAEASNVFVEAVSRHRIVPADFGDFRGGPHKTDDPGWVFAPGSFVAGEQLWFKALGKLEYWSPTEKAWVTPPNGEAVHYFGAIPLDATDPDDLEFFTNGTVWQDSGLSGPETAPIEMSGMDGSIHAHLDFCLRDREGDCIKPGVGHTGAPAVGAYTIEMQLFSNAKKESGQEKYQQSRAIKILLNNGLSADECAEAISSLIVPARVSDEALPASGILIMTGK